MYINIFALLTNIALIIHEEIIIQLDISTYILITFAFGKIYKTF
jgi:hypothetical protein